MFRLCADEVQGGETTFSRHAFGNNHDPKRKDRPGKLQQRAKPTGKEQRAKSRSEIERDKKDNVGFLIRSSIIV